MKAHPHRYETVETLIFDELRQVGLAVLPGAVCLPTGSVIELREPNRDAIVIGVRLQLTPGSIARVVVLVEDPRTEGDVIPRTVADRILHEEEIADTAPEPVIVIDPEP